MAYGLGSFGNCKKGQIKEMAETNRSLVNVKGVLSFIHELIIGFCPIMRYHSTMNDESIKPFMSECNAP